jgi:hypothetical protein
MGKRWLERNTSIGRKGETSSTICGTSCYEFNIVMGWTCSSCGGRYGHRIFMGRPLNKWPLRRQRRRWERLCETVNELGSGLYPVVGFGSDRYESSSFNRERKKMLLNRS